MQKIEYTICFENGPWEGIEQQLPYDYMEEGDMVGVVSHALVDERETDIEGTYVVIELHGFMGVALWYPRKGFKLPEEYCM